MMSSRFDPQFNLNSTSKTLNLSLLWFNKQSGYQNHDYTLHKLIVCLDSFEAKKFPASSIVVTPDLLPNIEIQISHPTTRIEMQIGSCKNQTHPWQNQTHPPVPIFVNSLEKTNLQNSFFFFSKTQLES